MTMLGPCMGRGAFGTAPILYPRARIASASVAAAPVSPLPLRTSTRVCARERIAGGLGLAVAVLVGVAAAAALWLVSGLASKITPATIRISSSSAAIPLATIAAVGPGRSASDLD